MTKITGPKQTIFVSARGEGKVFGKIQESDNFSCIHSHMLSSMDPPVYSISLHKKSFSYELIKHSRVFCVNFIEHAMEDIAKKCITTPGHTVDKFKVFGIEKDECETIDCPRVKEALAFVECELQHESPAGDNVIITGKIIRARNIKSGKRLFNLKDDHYHGV